MRLWKRNAVVAVVVLFVCVAVYLNWSYNREDVPADYISETDIPSSTGSGGKTLGDVTLVDNISPEDPNTQQGSESSENTYFAEARLSRQKARDNAIEILKLAADRENATQEIRDNAATEIESMAQNALTEARIENLIIAKGFTDCVAFINDGSINIVVSAPSSGLTQSDVAKITDIAKSESSIPAEKIKIVEVKG